MKSFQNRVAIVTGGGSGIGRALAHELARSGSIVIITDIHRGRIDTVLDELRSFAPDRVHGHHLDHTDYDQVRAFHASVMERWGRAEILCLNVGVGFVCEITDMTIDDWRRVMDLNFWSAVYMTQLFVPQLKANRQGAILFTASLAGLIGFPTCAAYNAAKFAVVGLAESLRAELYRYHINVTALCPGVVKTNFARDGHFSIGDLADQTRIEKLWDAAGEDPASVAKQGLKALKRNLVVAPSSFLAALPWMAKRAAGRLVNDGLAVGWKNHGVATRLFRKSARASRGGEHDA